MEALIVLAGIVAFDLLALRYGHDSRDRRWSLWGDAPDARPTDRSRLIAARRLATRQQHSRPGARMAVASLRTLPTRGAGVVAR